MNKSPLVSVIIACYNVTDYLENCFLSLDNQTYKNIQYVFLDDGSTDDTYKKILDKYGSNKKHIILTGENHGVATTRNRGIEAAEGEYVTFFDPDDIIAPDHIEKLVKAIIKEDADISVCRYEKAEDGIKYGELKFKNVSVKKYRVFDREDGLKQYLSQKYFNFNLWNKLYKKEILLDKSIRFIEGNRYAEDVYFNYLYFAKCKKTVFYYAKTYIYVQRKSSLVHIKFSEVHMDVYENLNSVIRDCLIKDKFLTDYAYYVRAAFSTEMIYRIYATKYKNLNVIKWILDNMIKDVKHIKKCKKVPLYRQILIPLVPIIGKMVYDKKIKKMTSYTPPKQQKILDGLSINKI